MSAHEVLRHHEPAPGGTWTATAMRRVLARGEVYIRALVQIAVYIPLGGASGAGAGLTLHQTIP